VDVARCGHRRSLQKLYACTTSASSFAQIHRRVLTWGPTLLYEAVHNTTRIRQPTYHSELSSRLKKLHWGDHSLLRFVLWFWFHLHHVLRPVSFRNSIHTNVLNTWHVQPNHHSPKRSNPSPVVLSARLLPCKGYATRSFIDFIFGCSFFLIAFLCARSYRTETTQLLVCMYSAKHPHLLVPQFFGPFQDHFLP